MNYKEAIDASVRDLQTFSKKNLQAMREYFGIQDQNLRKLAKHLLKMRSAHMLNYEQQATYHENVGALASYNPKEVWRKFSSYRDKLIEGIKTNNPPLVRFAIEIGERGSSSSLGADVSEKYADGWTPLMLAVNNWVVTWGSEDAKEIVDLLLETGESDPNAQNNNGDNALMLALQGRGRNTIVDEKREIVYDLLNVGGIDPSVANNNGETPLMMAAAIKAPPDDPGSDTLVRTLLDTGKVNPGAQDKNGNTALMWAVKVQNPRVIRTLLDTGEANLQARTKPGPHARIGKTAVDIAQEIEGDLERKVQEALDKDDMIGYIAADELYQKAIVIRRMINLYQFLVYAAHPQGLNLPIPVLRTLKNVA